MLSAWDIDNTRHLNILLSKIFVSKSIRAFFNVEKLPEENITTVTSGDESHIIIEPIDGSYLLDMTFALEVWWILIGVEIKDVGCIISICSGKKMTTVTESDFRAALNLNVFKQMKLLGQNIHKLNLILDGNDHMESTWMESYSQSIFWDCLGDLQCLGDVVPNLNGSIFGAGND